MDRGYNAQQFITLFVGRGNSDKQVEQMFVSEIVAALLCGGWG
jgi:hypothetical protein